MLRPLNSIRTFTASTRLRLATAAILFAGALGLFGLFTPGQAQAGFGFGVGRLPSEYLKDVVEPLRLTAAQGRWLRIDLPEPTPANKEKISAERAALLKLRTLGFKSCALLRFDPKSWKNGPREGTGHRLPIDLRDAYFRGQAFASAYGETVDFWEVDNEPDISFVQENAETFAAYHKAMYFGLRSVSPDPSDSTSRWVKIWRSFRSLFRPEPSAPARVLMAPLALPPGPYFERLLRDDFLNYTDGFNYHYYGYAEDFTGVYRQFEAAVTAHSPGGIAASISTRRLPVLLTEYGYGLLSGPASHTAEGRERQRRWFDVVARQISTLRLEGTMAFILRPYLELAHNEFGLFLTPPGPSAEPGATPLRTGEIPSPALRSLWDYAATHPHQSQPWSVKVTPTSPVVIDFVPGRELAQLKSHGGYLVNGQGSAASGLHIGTGRLIAYNFGSTKVTGVIRLGPSNAEKAPFFLEETCTLSPGERREFPVKLAVPASSFTLHGIQARFTPGPAEGPVARWSTSLLPAAIGMQRRVTYDFGPGPAGELTHRGLVAARPVAVEEPKLEPNGRWLTTRGVQVTETPGQWSFKITALPAEPLRPAMVELPLPENFTITAGQLLSFSYRLGLPQVMTEPQRPMLDAYFRTATGDLYQVWPRQYPRDDWQHYWQHAENFTMGFFGRAQGPWRFAEQRSVALVFFLRPTRLPASFEVGNAGIVTFAAPSQPGP